MNYLYAINFAPGFEELVVGLLKKAGVKIELNEEGFALVEFSKRVTSPELGFAKSIIEVFSQSDDIPGLNLSLPNSFVAPEGYRFSIRSFEGNRPSKLDGETRVEVIREVSLKTKLKYSAFEPDVDFIISKRKSGLCFFGMKLPVNKVKSEKGELHADVVSLLCELGNIKKGSKVLDAFAGHGGVSNTFLSNFEPISVVLVEKDSRLVNNLKPRFKSDKRARVAASDVVNYLKSTEGNFDLIVADPPWGEFEDYVGDLGKLYAEFLRVAKARVEPGGKIVMLSSKKEELEAAALASGMIVEARLNVLISGKKVLVLKLSTN
ncbi:MAG: tRNA (guanine6-N2)-methyltransferase [Patescibacteria group bacterium]|nr:tRNA (guanine6-N2)-methyltransferase [Patescibacteria group bacterium]